MSDLSAENILYGPTGQRGRKPAPAEKQAADQPQRDYGLGDGELQCLKALYNACKQEKKPASARLAVPFYNRSRKANLMPLPTDIFEQRLINLGQKNFVKSHKQGNGAMAYQLTGRGKKAVLAST